MLCKKIRKQFNLLLLTGTLIVSSLYTNASESLVSTTSTLDTDVTGLTDVQIEKSMVLSQFVSPFSNAVYHVMEDENIKTLLPELYKEDGSIPEIQYSKLLKKDSAGYKQATVADIFNIGDPDKPTKFYIEYEYEVTEVFDVSTSSTDSKTGKVSTGTKQDTRKTKKKDYKEVYYTNPYSLFYLTLFAGSNPNISSAVRSTLTKNVDMDMYGNIVIDDSKSRDWHRFLVVPNIANPALFTGTDYYLPTRKLLSIYQTKLHDLSGVESLKENKYKDLIGSKLREFEVSMYDASSPYMQLISTNILKFGNNKNYLSPNLNLLDDGIYGAVGTKYKDLMDSKYLKYLNISNDTSKSIADDYVYFIFGDDFKNKLSNRFQTDTHQGNFKLFGKTGLGRANSSVAVLPRDRLFLGSSFVKKDVDLYGDVLDSVHNSVSYYDINIYKTLGSDILVNKANWEKGFTNNEIACIAVQTAEYSNRKKKDVFKPLVDLSVAPVKDDGKPSTANIDTPKELYETQVSSIVTRMDHLFKNMGTDSAAINTSRMSKEYANLTSKFDKNYLFSIRNALQEPAIVNTLSNYTKLIIIMNCFLILLMFLKQAGSSIDEFVGYFKNVVFCVILSLVPVFLLSLFVVSYGKLTNATFKDSLLFWSAIDLEMYNSTGTAESKFTGEVHDYFRQYNINDLGSGATVSMFTGELGAKDKRVNDYSLSIIADNHLTNGGKDLDSLYYNRDNYYKSIFYYFYDNYRNHLYNYYKSDIDSGNFLGWDSDKGLQQTTGKVLAMLTDPVFLYGDSYVEIVNKFGADSEKAISPVGLATQDICGLSTLFNKPSGNQTVSMYEHIVNAPWYKILHTRSSINPKNHRKDAFDSDAYPNQHICGSKAEMRQSNRSKQSRLEIVLQKTNLDVAVELQKLQDYSKCKDETIIYMAALISTFEFSKNFNSYIPLNYELVPTGINSDSIKLDTIYRGIYMDKAEVYESYQGDVMFLVERNGGSLAQMFALFTTFCCQVSAFVIYCSIILIFIFSLFVFVYAYNFSRNRFNKAWIGLLFFAGATLLTHLMFILFVNSLSVPSYAEVRTTLFSGFSGIVKNVLFWLAVIAKTAVIGFLTYFALKHPSDLGGSIISEKASVIFENIQSEISNNGSSSTTAESAELSSDNITLNDSNSIDITDGTFQMCNPSLIGMYTSNNIDGIAALPDQLYTDSDRDLYLNGDGFTELSGSSSIATMSTSTRSYGDMSDVTSQVIVQNIVSSTTSSNNLSTGDSTSNTVKQTKNDKVVNQLNTPTGSSENISSISSLENKISGITSGIVDTVNQEIPTYTGFSETDNESIIVTKFSSVGLDSNLADKDMYTSSKTSVFETGTNVTSNVDNNSSQGSLQALDELVKLMGGDNNGKES